MATFMYFMIYNLTLTTSKMAAVAWLDSTYAEWQLLAQIQVVWGLKLWCRRKLVDSCDMMLMGISHFPDSGSMHSTEVATHESIAIS